MARQAKAATSSCSKPLLQKKEFHVRVHHTRPYSLAACRETVAAPVPPSFVRPVSPEISGLAVARQVCSGQPGQFHGADALHQHIWSLSQDWEVLMGSDGFGLWEGSTFHCPAGPHRGAVSMTCDLLKSFCCWAGCQEDHWCPMCEKTR